MLAAKIDPLHTKPEIISYISKTQRINKRKKRHNELGNEINPNNKDIMNDIAQGRIVKYYKETVYDTGLNDNKSKS